MRDRGRHPTARLALPAARGKPVAVLLFLAVSAVAVPRAGAAEFGIVAGSVSIEAVDEAGDPDSRAGAHPDRLWIDFGLAGAGTGTAARDVVFELPAGLVLDPSSVPPCPRGAFDVSAPESVSCPPGSQVGVAELTFSTPGGEEELTPDLYNVAPGPGESIALGLGEPLRSLLRVRHRPGDLGLAIELRDLAEDPPLTGGRLELWGVPADRQEGTGLPRGAFLTTPTRCDAGPLTLTLRTRSWQPGAPWLGARAESVRDPTGCGELPFEPRVELALTDPAVDAPTGVSLDVAVPRNDDPDGRASSHLRGLTATLPEGLTVSPGGAAGLSACDDGRFEARAACPPSSRVGTLELAGSHLGEPLKGPVYLGQAHASGRFSLLAEAAGAGVEARMTGSLLPDPVTGRIALGLEGLPEAPFNRIGLALDGGPGALLLTPLSCGPAVATAGLDPYSGAAPVGAPAIAVVGGDSAAASCLAATRFSPAFAAAVPMPRAGRATTFSMSVRRRDGEPPLGRFGFALPPGLVAQLGSVERCAPVAASTGACPPASRVGSAVAELGAGARPAVATGAVYLTGPDRRSPFGLLLALRTALGPFHAGALPAVRAALTVHPRNGRLSLESDPLPGVVSGVPVRFRAIALGIDRPRFLRNPTSCEEASVVGTARSSGEATARAAIPFAARRCRSLRFRPRFGTALRGRGKPGLRIAVRLPRGGAGLRKVVVVPPALLSFSASGLRAICSRRQAIDGICPRASRVGAAFARSPSFERPLRGAIHVVQPRGTVLPDLWLSLDGGGVHLDLRGRTFVDDGQLKTKLVGLPDLPLSLLRMRFAGGKRGVLSLKRNPCAGRGARRAGFRIVAEGQNGVLRRARPRLSLRPGCGRRGRSRQGVRPGGGRRWAP